MAQAGRRGTVRAPSQTLNQPPDMAGPPDHVRSFASPCGIPGGTMRDLRPTTQLPACVGFSWGPLFPPKTFQPPPQGPAVGRATGTCMLLAESALSPRGVAPPTCARHLKFTPSSLPGLPSAPKSSFPSGHPRGPGTSAPFSLPVTASTRPLHPGPSALASIPFPEPHWAPGRTPRVSRLSLTQCPPRPALSGIRPPWAQTRPRRPERAKTWCPRASLAGKVGMARPWALVGSSEPQQPRGCAPTAGARVPRALLSLHHRTRSRAAPSPLILVRGARSGPPKRNVQVPTSRTYDSSFVWK